ncbi:MAG: hypothetical protein WB020_01210, partial [Candidatus Dormiibacterota bacterium]
IPGPHHLGPDPSFSPYGHPATDRATTAPAAALFQAVSLRLDCVHLGSDSHSLPHTAEPVPVSWKRLPPVPIPVGAYASTLWPWRFGRPSRST